MPSDPTDSSIPNEHKEILQKALAYCAYQERSSAQVRQRLSQWGAPSETIKFVLKYLCDNKYLDDNRFTEMFVNGKLRINKWGRVKIIAHLRSMKIDEDLIRKHIGNIDSDYYKGLLQELMQKKLKELRACKELDLKRRKIVQFAAARGFESSLIFEITDKLL